MSNPLAKALVEDRASVGLGQRELARLSGVAQPSISRYESGKDMPSIPTLIKLAKALKVKVERFFRYYD